MRFLRRVWQRVLGLFNPSGRTGDFDEELESHLALHIEDNIRSGMSPAEARRVANLHLGGLQATREAYRDQATVPVLDNFRRDLLAAYRQLRRNPLFALASIAVLAPGFAASISIFAFVDAALLQPLPYTHPHDLVDASGSSATLPRNNLSYLDYLDLKAQNTVFESFDAYTSHSFLMGASSGSQLVNAMSVTPGFFRTLGIKPILGRDFDPGASDQSLALITHSAWRNRLGGRPDVIGQSILLSGASHTVIGVLPAEFQFAPAGNSEIWTPLNPKGSCMLRRSCHNLYGIARLKSGIGVEPAQANLQAIAARLEAQFPDSNRGRTTSIKPLSEEIYGQVRPILLLLLCGALLLLLISFINVVSLLLERAESRRREFAVRGALGASSLRLASQFLAESLVLVFCAVAAGLALASSSMKLLLGLIPTSMLSFMPYLQSVRISPNVAMLTAAISLVALCLFALAPAFYNTLMNRNGLTEGARGSSGLSWRRLGSRLVVFELITAMVLLMAAGLLGKSLYQLLHVEIGFNPSQLVSLDVVAPPLRYGKDADAIRLASQVLNEAARLPGVESVSSASQLPVSFNGNTTWIRVVGQPYSGEHNETNAREVSPNYFTTIQARLASGRFFTHADNASAPRVAIVNRTFASKYIPNQNPIGLYIGDNGLSPASIKQIVGLVEDIRDGALDSEIWPAMYVPFLQVPDNSFSLVVRTSQIPTLILPTLAGMIRKLDPEIGIRDEASMDHKIQQSPAAYLRRSSASLVIAFASLALILCTIGLYGVVSYSVQQRTREIGIRMALGAESNAVTNMVLREAGLLSATGVILGAASSLALSSWMETLLFQVKATDPLTLIAVIAVLAVATLLASYIPARRAASVNPLDSLRAD